MRKITLKSEEEKKKRTNQLIVGGILILIMFISVLGYSFQGKGDGDSKKMYYNGFEFVEQNGYWVLKDSDFIFRYNPLQVEEVDSELKPLNNYIGKPLYISSENEEATSEIYTNLNQIVQRIQYACLEENCKEDLPIKTCEDNFIIIQEKNKSEIIQENNCVFVQGPYENLTQLSDEFLFKILGIRE